MISSDRAMKLMCESIGVPSDKVRSITISINQDNLITANVEHIVGVTEYERLYRIIKDSKTEVTYNPVTQISDMILKFGIPKSYKEYLESKGYYKEIKVGSRETEDQFYNPALGESRESKEESYDCDTPITMVKES